MKKEKIIRWCVRWAMLLMCMAGLVFFCLMVAVCLHYQQKMRENQMQLVGKLYQEQPDMARQVLNQLVKSDMENATEEDKKAAKMAVIKYGYSENIWDKIGKENEISQLSALGIFVLIFVGTSLFFIGCSRKQNRLEQGLIIAELQKSQEAIRNKENLTGQESFLRRSCKTFTDDKMQALGNGVAEIISQYQILWENETRLREQMRVFTENVAHQLKTPLARMTLALDMQEKNNMEEKRNSCLHELEQIKPLVESILNVSRLESGKVTMASKPIDINLLLRDARKKTDGWENYQWEMKNDKEEMFLHGDEVWLLQAFLALYENVVRHTQSGEKICTIVENSHDNIRVEIHDKGGGISPQIANTLFERYRSADNQDITRTGIGLNLAKEVITRHHGKLQVYNENEGAVFCVILPIYPLKQSL